MNTAAELRSPFTPGLPGQPVLLGHAVSAYLNTLPAGTREAAAGQLHALNVFLGAPAPLLAYTRLTGEAWVRSLPISEQDSATELLTNFRAFLRDGGWLDAARPVNLPD